MLIRTIRFYLNFTELPEDIFPKTKQQQKMLLRSRSRKMFHIPILHVLRYSRNNWQTYVCINWF